MYKLTLVDNATGELAGLLCAGGCTKHAAGKCKVKNPICAPLEFDDFLLRYQLSQEMVTGLGYPSQIYSLMDLGGMDAGVGRLFSAHMMMSIWRDLVGDEMGEFFLQLSREAESISMEEMPATHQVVGQALAMGVAGMYYRCAQLKRSQDPLSLKSFADWLIDLDELAKSIQQGKTSDEVAQSMRNYGFVVEEVIDELLEIEAMEARRQLTDLQDHGDIKET